MASAKEKKQKSREKYIAQYGYEKFREMGNARNSVCQHSKKQKLSALEQACSSISSNGYSGNSSNAAYFH